MSLVRDFFDVMLDTEEFFHRTKARGNLRSLIHFGFVSLIALGINLILLSYDILPAGLMPFEQILELSPGAGPYISGVYFIAGFFFILFFAGLLSSILGKIGSQTSFRDSLKASSYSLTPSIITLWIPVLGVLLTLWSLYLIAMGLGVFNKQPLRKNLKASVLAGVIVALFMIVFLMEIGIYLLQTSGGSLDLLWTVLLPGLT